MASNYLEMVHSESKIPVFTDLETMDIYCEYLLNDKNKAINYTNLVNLYEYIDSMDTKLFITNDAKMARIYFILEYLDARINKGLTHRKSVLQHVMNSVEPKYAKIIQASIIDGIVPDTLGKKDIMFINDMVYTDLNHLYLNRYSRPLAKMVEEIETNTFGRSVQDSEKGIELLQSMLNDMTKARSQSKQQNRFSLTDERALNAMLSETCDVLLSEGQHWRCGMQGLNSMLNGGFENGRLYNFIGATGGFKSGLLLNLMKGIKLYNKGKDHKDPTKRPTILFISQENGVFETIARIFGIFGRPDSIKNYTKEEIISLMKSGGFRVVEDELDINIEFRYASNMEIGVKDIKGIIEELSNSGMEVIGVIQDYIERLRPPNMKAEKRIQLFDIANELHDMCMELQIWCITGSQFNRSGVSTIEDMKAGGKTDIGKQLGTSDVSESFAMLKNIDVNIGIVIEYDSDENRYYLSFRRLKFRGDDQETIDYFLQPFMGKDSKIQLMDDVNLDQYLYRRSMGEEQATLMVEDLLSLETMTRQTTDILSPIVDTDTEDILDFFNEHNKANQLFEITEFDQISGLHKNVYGDFLLQRKDKK